MAESSETWSEIDLAGHACRIYEPPVLNEHGYVLVYLHGLHQEDLAGQSWLVEMLDRHRLPLIAPQTKRSWWTDRICREFDPQLTAERYVIDHVVPHVRERWQTAPPQIALLGVGMGGQGALRLAFKHPDTFPVVAGIAPAVDYHRVFREGDSTLPQMYESEEHARQDTAILHMHPLYWPRNVWFCCDPYDRWHDSNTRLAMKLSSLGIPFDSDLQTAAGGHTTSYYAHIASAAFGHIAEKLERERLRLV